MKKNLSVFLLVMGCNQAMEPADMGVDVLMDGAVDNSVDAALPDMDVCQPPTLDVSVREGGSFTMTFAELGEYRVAASPALVVVDEEESQRIYIDYGLESIDMTLTHPTCAEVTIPLTVLPLEWETLSRWNPDGEAGRPPTREYGAWWYQDGAVHIVSGFHYQPRQFTPANDAWRFDLTTKEWTEYDTVNAPFAPGARIAVSPTGQVAIFGGGSIAENGRGVDTVPLFQNIKRNGNTLEFESMPMEDTSVGNYTGALVYDTKNERWLSLCGVDGQATDNPVHCNLREYQEFTGWRDVEVSGEGPAGRYGFHYAYDEDAQRIIVVAGQSIATLRGRQIFEVSGETWAMDLSAQPRWVKIFSGDPMVRRRNGAYVFDPVGRRLILWGGTPDGAEGRPGLSILRVEPGFERWDHVPMPDDIPMRTSGYAVYDPDTRRAYMGFGNDGIVGDYADLYALSL